MFIYIGNKKECISTSRKEKNMSQINSNLPRFIFNGVQDLSTRVPAPDREERRVGKEC